MTARGLEGVIATESAISAIVDGRLLYRGIPIEEVAQRGTFPEVAYLLWHDRLPRERELAPLERDLAQAWELPREVVARLRSLPAETPMLVALREGVQALALADPRANEPGAALASAIRVVGALPAIAAQAHHVAAGRPLFAPRVSGPPATRFLHAIRGDAPSRAEARALDQALILFADHELNASTFTARVVASTQADLYSAVVAALCTLKGPLHGGATAEVWRFVTAIPTVDEAAGAVEAALAAGRRIPGFGHRVYQGLDPRAAIFRDLAYSLGGDERLAVADAVADAVVRQRGLYPNVDFYAVPLYETLGFTPDLATAIFALGRSAGWTAHILEQYANNKLIRPRAQYTGAVDRRWLSPNER